VRGEGELFGWTDEPLLRVVRYKAYLLVFVLGAVASSFSWLLVAFEEPEAFNRVAYPLMTILCAILAAVLWWRGERVLRFVGLLGYAGGSVFLLAKACHALYVGHGRFGALDELPEISSWSPVLIFGAFLVLGVREGLAGSLLFYAALLGVTLPYAVPELLAGEDADAIRALVQLYLSNAVVIVLLFGVARLTEDYVKTRIFSEAMERLANTDFLTGVANRRHLYELLRNGIEEAARYGRPLSVVMFDLDDFKKINDGQGHDVGDRVLKEVASLVGEHLRKADQLSRWGGEEFLVLAPETNLEQAGLSAVRLKQVIEDGRFGEAGRVTASFGVTAYRDGDTPESLLKRADEALYRAKGGGKNRVVTEG
jgi:diguanylate cyclase